LGRYDPALIQSLYDPGLAITASERASYRVN